MTPSPIRSVVSRRARLLAASALAGSVLLVSPALAGTLPGIPSAANIIVSSGGSQPSISFPDAITLQIDLNAPRTVINWTDLHLSSGDAMNFLFDAASDIVLNKTTSQIRFDSGSVVTGKIGAATAGNVWFYSPQGVIVSPGATMTAGSFVFSRGSAINDVGFVGAADPLANLQAATDALIKFASVSTATDASIDGSGNVVLSQSSGNLQVDLVEGTTATVSTALGSITIGEMATSVGAAEVTARTTAIVTKITGATDATVSTTTGSITVDEITATSGAASVMAGGPGATVHTITGATGVTVSSTDNTSVTTARTSTSGDIVITSGDQASLTVGDSARDILITAPTIFMSTVDAVRDVILTGVDGVTVTNRITAGDDVELTASNGDVAAGGAYIETTGLGAPDDAHILLRSDTGSVTANNTLLTGGTGARAGDITIDAATAATFDATIDSSRNLTVTASNALSLTDAYSAAGTASFTSTAGSVTQAGGSITAGTLTVSAHSGIALTQAGNNVANLDVIDSGLGSFSYRDSDSFTLSDVIVASGDVSLTSTSGGITQSLGLIVADTLSVTAATGIALNENNSVASLGVMNNTTSGSVSFRDIDNFDITDDIDSAGNVSLFSSSGDITQSGGTLHAGGFFSLDASGLIAVGDITAGGGIGAIAAGDIDVTSATAGGGVSLLSNGGHAILRKAVLTGSGATDNLSVVAAGDAVLGADDYLTITTDNVFNRTGGGAGTAIVRSISGDALIHLDTSAGFTQVDGLGVDVTVNTGPAAFGAVTASLDDVYIEALDGALSVETATAANGDVSLYSAGGDLTITGSVHGGGLVHIESDSLLDGHLSSLISSDGDLELIGAGVDVTHIQADGMVEVTAFDTNAYVELAEAGQTVLMAALNGDATLRGAQGPDGVILLAYNKATFGADDRGSINPDNYAMTNPSCGCGFDGLQVSSINGDAIVNINYASNGIDLVGSSPTGNVSVVLTSGDLKINEVAGYNISLTAADGTLEVGHVVSAGGDYSATAHNFLGANTLTPDLFNGVINDVTILDTLGGMDLGTLALHADHWLTIEAREGNDLAPITGAAQLSAGSGLNNGRVTVTGEGVALDSIVSDGLVYLDGGTGLVDVATSVDVWGNYNLRGGDFANAALTPQGDMRGTWSITDRVGGFDFSGKTLHYGGGLNLFVDGVVNGGDITVDLGAIYAEADSGRLGTLTAPMSAAATSTVGDLTVDLIKAGSLARVRATGGGTARLGAAIMSGAGTPEVQVEGFGTANAILGAATPGAITAANVVTSTGAAAKVSVTSVAGRTDINLDHITGADLTTVSGPLGVGVKVATGPLRLGDVASTNGAILIDSQALTLNGTITSGRTVSIASHGGMTFTSSGRVTAGGAGDAIVLASDGVFTNGRGADAVSVTNPAARWLIYTQAFGAPLGSTSGNSFNGLVGRNYYGSAYDFTTRTFSQAPTSGNRFVHAYRPALTVTADALSKIFGQGDPPLTYRITAGTLLAGDAFTGGLAREAGDTPGLYAITQGSLAQDMNYDLSFTGATFTIQQVPTNDQGGVPALKVLNQSPDFTLDWDPAADLTTEGQAAGGGTPVASLR